MSQIFQRLNLSGGMALESNFRFLRRDSAAVVRHTDVGFSAVSNFYHNAVGPGIDGILHQFFYDGKGPFDDLAGGDFIRYKAVQYLYHFSESSSISLISFCISCSRTSA